MEFDTIWLSFHKRSVFLKTLVRNHLKFWEVQFVKSHVTVLGGSAGVSMKYQGAQLCAEYLKIILYVRANKIVHEYLVSN